MSGSDLQSSIFSALCARSLAHPFDTMRVRRISNATREPLRLMGWKTLSRGFWTAVIVTAPGTSAYLMTYYSVMRHLDGLPHQAAILASATVAEAVACIVFTPFEVVRQRQQAGLIEAGTNVVRAAWDIRRQLYRGYGLTVLTFAPYSMVFFSLLDRFRPSDGSQSPGRLLLASGAAATIAAAVTQPLNVLQTRRQTGRIGATSLWAGLGPRCAFAAINTGVSVALFEYLTNKE